MDRLTDSAVAPIVNRSYEITIPIERAKITEDGVFLAHGDFESGYTFYIQNNKLVYEHRVGKEGYTIVSDIDVPVGKSLISYQFDKTGSHKGDGKTLYQSHESGRNRDRKYIAVQIVF